MSVFYFFDKERIDNKLISISLNEEFDLYEGQSVIVSGDLNIKVVEFINAPCPEGVYCFWSGIGIDFQYTQNGIVKTGINLVQAFGYRVIIIESDYESYARLKVVGAT